MLVTRCQIEFEKQSVDETERNTKLKEIEECQDAVSMTSKFIFKKYLIVQEILVTFCLYLGEEKRTAIRTRRI